MEMNQIERNQMQRYDLQERRPRLTELTDNGTRIMTALTALFVAVLGALTYAAVQVFDGWHHAIVIADIGLVIVAVAVWMQGFRAPDEIESDTGFVPAGIKQRPRA